MTGFDDNAINGIVAFGAQYWRAGARPFDWKYTMSSLKVKLGILAAGLMLSGCMQATTYEATNLTTFKPRDKELLAKVRYANTPVAEPFRRAIVDYHRKEAPGSIVVDSDNHYLYLRAQRRQGDPLRHHRRRGSHGVVRHRQGRQHDRVADLASDHGRDQAPRRAYLRGAGSDNPMGSRALYLYSGGKDTLFRIHGTNQPEYIGASISSGCIRMTNEDVIDLYNRVKMGTIVVVLEPQQGDSPYNSQMALQGGGSGPVDAVAGPHRSHWTIKSAGFAGAFSLPAWLFAGGRLGRHRIRRRPISPRSDLAATSRGGASSGRSAGNSGAICGSGSHTFHWQIR